MIRPLLLSIALVALSVCAFGQYNPNQVRKVNSLPATCTPGTTTPVVYGAVVYTCTATNTWTANQTPGQLPTSTYAGLPTCSSGNDGQLYQVTDANRDVYSCYGTGGKWVSRNGGVYYITDFGATGNGSTDDSVAVQAAHDAAPAGSTIYFPTPVTSYRLATKVNVSKSIHFTGNQSKIVPDIPAAVSTANGISFYVTTSNVSFDGLWFNGTGITTTPTTGTRVIIQADGGSNSTAITNFSITNCRFSDLLQYNGTKPAILIYETPAFILYTHNVTIANNYVDTTTGWGFFLEGVVNGVVNNNHFNDCGMSSVVLYADNHNVVIKNNTVTQPTVSCYWGGGIDLFSQHSGGLPINTDMEVSGNFLSGYYHYGAVIRVGSGTRVDIHDNRIQDATDPIVPGQLGYIRVTPRGGDDWDMTDRGIRNVNIHDNQLMAGIAGPIGIFVDNTIPGSMGHKATNLPVAEDISITGNKIFGLDATHYFTTAILAHGQDGGMRGVKILNNYCEARVDGYSLLSGNIIAIAQSSSFLSNVLIQGNTAQFWDNHGGMSGASSNDSGIVAGQYLSDATVVNNSIRQEYYGVYLDSNSARVTGVDNNVFLSLVSTNTTPATSATASVAASVTTIDFNTGLNQTRTFGAGNAILAAANVPVGFITITLIQDATGGRIVTWNSLFKFSSASAPVLSIAASAKDQFSFRCDGTNCYLQSAIYDVR